MFSRLLLAFVGVLSFCGPISAANAANERQILVKTFDFPQFRELGCFTDSISDRVLPIKLGDDMTPETCNSKALASKYHYAGVEYGGECWAGWSGYNRLGASSGCDRKCKADPSENCGGGNALRVFDLGRPQYIYGVNIGGWLVLEPWITPSVFDQFVNASKQGVDEWTLCEVLGAETAKQQLEQHWQTWFTEEDMQKIAAAGLTHIRIPIGYWAFNVIEGEPFVQGHLPHLKNALEWARKYHISVLLDLHGAPGSQNGFDNSGRRGSIHWHDGASGSELSPNMARTLSILRQAQEFVTDFKDVVEAIELVNEPFTPIPIDDIKNFYQSAYDQLRKEAGDGLTIVMHDAFRLNEWNGFQTNIANNTIIDTHIYHVFDTSLLALNEQQHLSKACNNDAISVRNAVSDNRPVVVGEYCLAITDCAKWLNGFGVGARWDGTYPGTIKMGSCDGWVGADVWKTWSDERRLFLRNFAEVQMAAYEEGQGGWFFWNFKTEMSPEWNYLLGVEQGWIPSPPFNRSMSCTGFSQ